jgi:AcrR family transcriptional regulator
VVLSSPGDDGSVRDRLISAADAEIALHGVGAVKMEAVARRAGVSRATAFRQLGTVHELLLQVALKHAKRLETAVQIAMAEVDGTLAKIETALIYTARELPADPSMLALITGYTSSSHHPQVHAAALRVMAPLFTDGQRRSEIRDDVGIDELVDYVVEQIYLAADADDRSEDAVRRRFRHFIAPALAPRDGNPASAAVTSDLTAAVRTALDAVEDLARKLRTSS